MSLPLSTANELKRLQRERLKPFVVLLERDFTVMQVDGAASWYGLHELKPGMDCRDVLPILHGIDIEDPSAYELPCIEIPSGAAGDVRLIKNWPMALFVLDATELRDHQQQVQQVSNEVQILNYRNSKLYQELKEAHKELEIKNQEVVAANQLKSRFISSMSHEFRTPLASVLGYSGQVLKSPLTQPQKEQVQAIERGAKYLLGLVNNLLDQGSLDNKENLVQLAPTYASAVLNDIKSICEPLAQQKNLAFSFSGSEHLPTWLEMDETRFRQVAINLVGNAIKFTDSGKVAVSIQWDAGDLSFAVSDTGPGIPDSEQERIFNAFQRVEGNNAAGAGLGLSITRNIIQQMGGQLDLESKVGQGSTFSIQLPAPECPSATDSGAETAPVKQAVPSSLEQTAPKQIVLAEDDQDLAALISMYLDEAGFDVVIAEDEESTVAAALDTCADLVITDINLNGSSGLSVISSLKAGGFKGSIFTLTASPSDADRISAIKAGCDEYLLKPIDAPVLINLINKYVEA